MQSGKHIQSGKYKLIGQDNSSLEIHLNKSQAKFMFNAFIRLGFKEIKLLTQIHNSDIPKWERL